MSEKGLIERQAAETVQRLRAVPMDLEGANEFVARYHRHHQPVAGHKFSIGAAVYQAGKWMGVMW